VTDVASDYVLQPIAPPDRQNPNAQVRDFGVLGSALLWLCLCAVSGAAVMTTGVFILAGLGWALIAVSVFLFAVAGLIRTGIVNG
jgi:hypothetical protein